MNQTEPWTRVLTIIHEVKMTIGSNLSHEFRSTQTYQAYTGLCGEAYHAFQDGELDDELVDMLADYAARVIALHAELAE